MKLITERVRILAHFTIGDQFMGFSESPVSDSSHHTMISGDENGAGLRENRSGLGGGVILQLHATNKNPFSEPKSIYTTITRQHM